MNPTKQQREIYDGPNDNETFFKFFQKGQKITGTALVDFYKKFKGLDDLHFEEYGASKQGEDIKEWGEEFITVWKDIGNASVNYKGKYKVSFVLSEIISDIEIFECIFIK